MTDRFETRADFEKFQQTARQRWEALWQADKLVVSVGVDSSSDPKGASRVLAAAYTSRWTRFFTVLRSGTGTTRTFSCSARP